MPHALPQTPPFYTIDENDWIMGNDPARGPWTADGCHGGAAAAIFARALELAVPDKQLTRLTIDLFRPVPMSGFRIETDIGRNGRMVTTIAATLINREGKRCASATGLLLRAEDLGDVPNTTMLPPDFASKVSVQFPGVKRGHDLPTFADFTEIAFPAGQPFSPGPNTMWMRTTSLIEGETMSGFQTLCPLADCGNGFSRNESGMTVSFINPDLSINFHRDPVSRWIGASFSSQWESTGRGVSLATLFDTQGPIGAAQQTLLLQRV